MKTTIVLLFVCCLFGTVTVSAQSTEENAIASRVERLRQLLINPEKQALETLVTDALTYGHSSGMIEDKAAFIEDLLSGKTQFKNVAFSDQTIQVSGDAATVRNHFAGNPVSNPDLKIDIIVLMVWQKQQGEWKLLARQGAKIPG